MVRVIVKRVLEATEHTFHADNVAGLQEVVEESTHFGPYGFLLEDGLKVALGCISDLQDGMVFIWHPLRDRRYCTKRELLQQRLPEPRDGESHAQLRLQLHEPEAWPWRAIPKQVLEWPTEELEKAIREHVDDADNSNAGYSALIPGIEPLLAEKEERVAEALRNELLSRLGLVLVKEGRCMKWDWEQVTHIFEPFYEYIAAHGAAAAQQAVAALGGDAAHCSALAASAGSSEAAGGSAAAGEPATAGSSAATGGSAAAGEPATAGSSEAAGRSAAAGEPATAGSSAATGGSAAGGSAVAGGPTGCKAAPPMAVGAGATASASEQMPAVGERAAASGAASNTSYLMGGREDLALVARGAALEQRQQQIRERMAFGAAAPTGSQPDTVQLEWELAACKYVAVGDYKRYAKLFKEGKPLPLVGLWSETAAAAAAAAAARNAAETAAAAAARNAAPSSEAMSAWDIINDLFSQMAITGVQHGWLSCYCATWLAWRPMGSDRLFLSRPFLHDVTAYSAADAVTTVAALSWLQQEACTAWLEGRRHKLSMELFAPPFPDEDDDQGGLPWPDSGGAQIDPQDVGVNPEPPNKKRLRTGKTARRGSKSAPVQRIPYHAFQLGEKIGEGASAVVYSGQCKGVEAAIKMVFLDNKSRAVVRHEVAVYQVLRAAQAAGAIPTLLGVGGMRLGSPFIAMSLVEGTHLSGLSCITPEVRVAAMSALRLIHASGVAHGDLRYANIIVVQQPGHSASGSVPGDTSAAPGSKDSPLLGATAAGAGTSHCETQTEGRSGTGSDGVVTGEGGVRVVIIDFGLARLNASRARLQAEKCYLQHLLR